MKTTKETFQHPLDDVVRTVADAGAEAARKAGPLVTSAVLAVASILLLIGFVTLMRAGAGGASSSAAMSVPSGSPLGDGKVACPGGEEVKSSFETDGDTFSMVGKLASIESGGDLLVRGPTRYVQMQTDTDAARNANLKGGDVIRIEGKIDEGQVVKAMKISQVCDTTASPTAKARSSTTPGPSDHNDASTTPKPTVAAASTAPTNEPRETSEATPKPSLKPTPTATPDATPPATKEPTGGPQSTATPGAQATTAR